MKCRRCKAPAVIDVRRHNAAFCRDCFLGHCREQVRRAIAEFEMFTPDDRILVAVSGGKDSLALWHLLRELGYTADGLYLGLGIADYSDESEVRTRTFAERHGLTLHVVSLPEDHGYDIPTAAVRTRRSPCGACGLSKRHLFNAVAREHGYDVVATGHNLDDEAAVLLGNVLHWEAGYLGRQFPVLPETDGFARKVKPLVKLGEREMAAYCVLFGIEYQVDKCPLAEGNRHLGYKEVLNDLEARSPGTKAAFLNSFLTRGHQHFRDHAQGEQETLNGCESCGAPTTATRCAFCSLRDRVAGTTPVSIGRRD
ncbi:MAG: ATP-binding protein [Actinomycetes bacterium]